MCHIAKRYLFIYMSTCIVSKSSIRSHFLGKKKKKEFYSNLTMEGITDSDYKHSERIWEDL